MSPTVAVVGAGFAGIGAAASAAELGARVTVVCGRAGGSELWAGALDGEATELGPGLEPVAHALGIRLGETQVATREGVVRIAHGADSALLALERVSGKHVAVIDAPRDDWDGALLAMAWGKSQFASRTGTTFSAAPLELVEQGFERRISAYDFAALLDDDERFARVLARARTLRGFDGLLFGPWLGISRARASELEAALGIPVGETTSPPGGPAGARFTLRREQLLSNLGARSLRDEAVALVERASDVEVRLASGESLVAERVVVASGGVASGAVRLSGTLSGALPLGFKSAIAGLPLELDGQPVETISSLFGVDLAARGLGSLERIGVACEANGRVRGYTRVFAAGDSRAGAPRGALSALSAGFATARELFALKSTSTGIARFSSLE